MVGSDYSNGETAVVREPGGTLRRLEPYTGYPWSTGVLINNTGWVAGLSYGPSTDYLPTMWAPDGSVYLLTLPGWKSYSLYDMNDRGEMIGAAIADGRLHSFIYRPGVGMQELVLPGRSRFIANGIGEDGTLVGYYVDNGQRVPVALTPTPDASSALTAALGLLMVAGIRKRRTSC